MLELVNVIKNYGKDDNVVVALKGISLAFRKNEFVSVLGQSGCGKTTMLNIIGGLDRYTSGDLIINGVSTKNYKDSDWDSYRNHSIGFVFQNYNLITHLSVLQNVEIALTLSGVSAGERKKAAEKALERVGLSDQKNKRPNQLSGGQMQRVAIARALVNDPDVILADEPTGALDSQTSVQVMDLLREVAKDKLVIMVTHNESLAVEYSTRIVKLLDGVLIEDSNPYTEEEKNAQITGDSAASEQIQVEKKQSVEKKKKEKTAKTSMDFLTALTLSFNNLKTKKLRTILISFAGSIGIIGIALVLALSNGFTAYINKLQSDTLSSYPIEISDRSLDLSSLSTMASASDIAASAYPTEKEIKVTDMSTTFVKKNVLTEDYVENVIKKIDPEYYNTIMYSYGMHLNIFTKFARDIYIDANSSFSIAGYDVSLFDELMEDPTFLTKNYDVLQGKIPTQKNEALIVVNKYNQMSSSILKMLGITVESGKKTVSFDEIIGTEFKVLTNDELYYLKDDKIESRKKSFSYNGSNISYVDEATYNGAQLGLKIVGIIRVKEDVDVGIFDSVIYYTSALTEYLLDKNADSEVLTWQKAHKSTDFNTNKAFQGTAAEKEAAYEANIALLGGSTVPSAIRIYPKDFASKEKLLKVLDDYNDAESAKEDGNPVYYNDMMAMLVTSLNTMVDAVSYVLIAFTAISLVVSSIMIGVITYISVLERTKEIGILRSIGARKKDISRVFNAETVIIGFVAGALGVLVTYLLSVPINMILESLVSIKGLAALKITDAVILVIISMALTLIAGIIPSRIAAKRDPVVALRTE